MNRHIDPILTRGNRPRTLATALACAIAALLAEPATGAPAPSNDWIRLRADPALRLFPDMAVPRSGARPAGSGTTWPVTNCNDAGAGSLRDTVAGAGSGDIIDLGTLGCGTITLQTGAIPVPLEDLTLLGPGRGALTIDGNGADRAFFHNGRGTLTLQAMTVQNGRNLATGIAGGGCIASAGYVVLADATVRNCYAGGEGAYGGAIYAYSLTLANSTLSGNVANGVLDGADTAAFGGAAFVYQMQFTDSTVSGNSAQHQLNPGHASYDIGGGVVSVLGGSMVGSTIDSNVSQGRGGGIATFNSISASNSTISTNSAVSGIGGGLLMRAPSGVQLANSTITGNQAGLDGGGLWLNTPGTDFESSIVWGNSTDVGNGGNEANPAAPTTITGGNNLIGSSSPGMTLPADSIGTDPRLGPLADNGGPTRTHALLRGSPAVDAGNNLANLAFDQRGAGYPRVYGAAIDMGAFEQQALPVLAVTTPVPTLSRWMLAVLALLIAAIAGISRARRGDTRSGPG